MIKITTPDFTKMSKTIRNLDKDTRKAFYRAQNKGVRKFKTESSRQIRKIYTKIRSKDINKSITLKLANMNSLKATIKVSSGLTPIQDGLLRTKSRTKKGNIKVNIKNNKTKLLSKTLPKPFIMKVGGKTIVVRRKGKERNPVTQIKTVSIPQMITQKDVSYKLTTIAENVIDKEFNRLLNFKGEKF